MTINWQYYDDKFFQSFCNALLSVEVSKSFIPFSASGRDGGIDGLYAGEYDNKSGIWRFQDKFHKTSRKQDYNKLKSELISELKKLKNEDHFVILTNVSVLPQERDELLSLALKELRRLKKERVTFDVWDEAKIHTLYIRHPILKMWIEEGFTTAQLISYQDYFGKRLQMSVVDPGTLGNEFIARESDLAALKEFLYSNEKTIAVVSGEAGIGKTRLVLEFLKRTIDHLTEWQALVLNTYRLNFDKVAFAISGESKIIILVDDAHNYSPDAIAEIRNLTRLRSEGRLKLILTGRKVTIDQALGLIPKIDDTTILAITLKKLSPDETKLLFHHHPNIGRYEEYIDGLVRTSNGRPILIVALLRAIHKNIPIPQIKNHDFLKNYVRDYFNAVIEVTSEYTQVSKLILVRILRLICLLEPLPVNDDKIRSKIAEWQNIQLSVLEYFMDRLIAEGLAISRHNFSISPDYYSDIMLATGDQQLVIETIAWFPENLSNMVVNLTAADEAYEAGQQNRLGLNAILALYLPGIQEGDNRQVSKILETVSLIAYNKQEFAKEAVQLLIKRLASQNSDRYLNGILVDIRDDAHYGESLYNSLSRILHDLLYHPENERFVFDVLLIMNNYVPDQRLFKNTFALGQRNIINGYDLHQQFFFVDEAVRTIQRPNAPVLFFVECFKELLQLELTMTSMDQYKNGQMTIRTYYLPSIELFFRFRLKVIQALIGIYKQDLAIEIKNRALKELLDVPRAISASKRSKDPYKGTDEILLILEFLEGISDSLPLKANREILDRLFWLKRWGADSRVVQKIDSIGSILRPKSLSEKILFLLADAEHRVDHNWEALILHIEEQSKELIDEYSADEIAQSMAEVRKAGPSYIEFIWVFNKALHQNYLEKTRTIYDSLWNLDREYLFVYGSDLLRAIRFKHNDSKFYWQKISQLESEGSGKALNIALYVYSGLKNGIDDQDVEFIERTFRQAGRKPEIGVGLSMALLSLLQSGYFRASELIKELFDISTQRVVDNFLLFGRESNETLLKRLVLDYTVRFQLSFEIQQLLGILVQKNEINEDELFDYFTRRFKVKQQHLQVNDYGGYEFVPHDNFSMLTNDANNGRQRIFLRAVNWFVHSKFEGMESYYAKDLLEFLRPSKELTKDLVAEYQRLLKQLDKPQNLPRLVESLEVFETKTRELVYLIITILRLGKGMSSVDWDELRSRSYSAITAVGAKSGSVGEPFQVDVELRELVNQIIKESPNDEVATDFLKKVRQNIESEIARSSDRDEIIW